LTKKAKTYVGVNTTSSTNGVGETGYPQYRRLKFDPCPFCTKMNSNGLKI
jgi:hypothetical protein